jgi:hypothetical protein
MKSSRRDAQISNWFEVVDVRGYVVTCTEETWCDKILGARPKMRGWEDLIKEAIRKPSYICSDRLYKNRQVYYMLHDYKGNKYIKVVVKFNSKNIGRVISAYSTDSGKAGEKIIWTPSNS